MKYHLNPTTDRVNACKARTRPCPFGDANEHFESEQDARAFQEDFHRLTALTVTPVTKTGPFVQAAVDLTFYTEAEPTWWEREREQYRAVWAEGEPELLGSLDFNGERIALVWEPQSRGSGGEPSIIRARGMQMRRLTMKRYEDGQDVGFVTTAYADEESVRFSWGDTDRALKYLREFEGHGRLAGFRYEDGEMVDYAQRLRDEPESAVEIKQVLWASFHKELDITPASLAPLNAGWLSNVNLTSEHAPEDEAELDADLARVQKVIDEDYEAWRASFNEPTIDYAEMEDEYRGKRLGAAMYVIAARRLAQEGQGLQSSGLQSDDAVRVWTSMAQDDRLPMKVTKRVWSRKDRGGRHRWNTTAKLILDFRRTDDV